MPGCKKVHKPRCHGDYVHFFYAWFLHCGTVYRSATQSFTETWLSEHILESSLYPPGFNLLRMDCLTELSWWNLLLHKWGLVGNHIVLTWRLYNRKHFYSPREFSSFVLVGVHIPPQACVSEALLHLAEKITNVEKKTLRLSGTLTEQTSAMNSQNTDSILSGPPGILTH